jgi:cytidylate kinase
MAKAETASNNSEKSVKKANNQPSKAWVITVSGPHGTGKSTYARVLAEDLGLRYVCAGELFRELAKERGMSLESFSRYAANNPEVDHLIDERTRTEAKNGGVVIDAQLGAWMVRDQADLKLLLIASDAVRFNRIAQRDHVSFEFARNETFAREEIQRLRYKKYYGIDVSDLSIYNLKIDTGLHSIDFTRKIILDAVRNLLQRQGTTGLGP